MMCMMKSKQIQKGLLCFSAPFCGISYKIKSLSRARTLSHALCICELCVVAVFIAGLKGVPLFLAFVLQCSRAVKFLLRLHLWAPGWHNRRVFTITERS